MSAAFVLTLLLAGEPALPPGGVSLLADDALLTARFTAGGLARREVVEVTGQPFDKAVRLTIDQAARDPWTAQLVVATTGPVKVGDVLFMSVRMRGANPADEAGEAKVRAYLQSNRPPNEKVLTLPLSAGDQWTYQFQATVAARALPAGESNVTLHLALAAQTVELADLQLLNYGDRVRVEDLPRQRATYRGQAPDAPWRRAAAERIERYRKGELMVRVVDAAGRPVRGAVVEIAQQRHRFGFGAAVTGKWLNAPSPDGEKYRETVARLYNKVVFENDLKWSPWEVSRSNTGETYRREWTEAGLAWLNERGIAVRGHYLTWAPLNREEERQKYLGQPERLRRELWAHLADKAPAVGSRVVEWDVINHIAGWGETFATVTGGYDIYVEIIKEARRLVPAEVELWVNEGQLLPGGSRLDHYEEIIRYLLERGARPDGIGFMGHFGAGTLTPPDIVYERLERFAKLIPSLQLTELDVDLDDEATQADYLRDVMTIAFSHPAMRGIVMWGFWEGKHWKPKAALYRRDWTAKPAGEAWEKLVYGDWWTKSTATTDAAGQARVRGFCGTYAITVEQAGRRATASCELPREGAEATVRLP